MTAADLLYRVALAASAGAGLPGLLAWRFRGARWGRVLWGGTGVLVWLVALAAWAARWVEAGHLPIFGTYESALSLSVAVLGAALLWEWRGSFDVGLVPAGAVVAALLLAHGLGYDSTVYALTISERSWVVDAHAVVAWAAFGVLAANAGLAAVELWAPGAKGLEDGRWVARTLELGFFLHSAMMASGSLYRFLLFGRAWSFDPIETLGFVAWVGYGALLHMHLFAQWRGRRLAAWSLGLFVVLVVSYRFIVYFPSWSTYHIFDVSLREHLMG